MVEHQEPHLTISFKGAQASENQLNMRQLGKSLIGMDRIISIGLDIMERGEIRKNIKRSPFEIRVAEPRSGSFEIYAWLEASSLFLPLFHEVFLTGASEILWRWTSTVLLKNSGRHKESTEHYAQLIDVVGSVVETVNEIDLRRHEEILTLQKLKQPCRDVVSPVGDSCDRIILSVGDKNTEIDLPMAHVIRSREQLFVSEIKRIVVKVDGFNHQNRQLKVTHPDFPNRFFTAYVRDPDFGNRPNIYTDAAVNQKTLLVTVEEIRRVEDNELKQMHIFEAKLA